MHLNLKPENLVAVVGMFRLPVDFEPFPTNETEAFSLTKLVEFVGFVQVDEQSNPCGQLHILCIHPRKQRGEKFGTSSISPRSEFDQIGLYKLWKDHKTRLILSLHPSNSKARMFVADINSSEFQKMSVFAEKCLEGSLPMTTYQLGKVTGNELKGFWKILRVQGKVNIAWDSCVVAEKLWKRPDYR